MHPDHAPHNSKGPRARSLLTPQFLLVLSATAIFGISFSTYFLLPKFLAVELSADAGTIGSVSAITLLASVFFMPFIGVQIDRHGRKLFAALGASIFALTCTGFLFVDSIGPLLWILRIVQGLAFTLFYVSLSTLATDISPAERLGQAIGLFGAIMIATNAIGPALAEWVSQAYGWTAVFSGTIGAAVVSAVLTLFIPEQRRERAREDATSMLQVIRRPGLQRILSVAVMVGWTFGAVFTFYQPWALLHGFEHVSGFLIAFATCAMCVRIGLGGLGDRVGRMRVAQAALLLYIATPLAVIWLDVFGLLVSGALLGLAHGLFFPALNAVALEHARDTERGKAMAAYHGAFNVGFSVGSYLMGYIAMATSYPTIFGMAVVTCSAAFVLLATTARTRSRDG